ncbi:uncharacterized protein [Rutidosis leptorrhynchoides]|uniref:uncharacterized protein n=1 Tax=Rutidosis leptorrhynchoides TaxID=125765 RepID=UPI003A98F8B2
MTKLQHSGNIGLLGRIQRALGELGELNAMISTVKLGSETKVRWRWHPGANGYFTTNNLNSLIDEKNLRSGNNIVETIRNKFTPKKVEIFVWRTRKKRLPVLCELDKRGIDLHSVRCPLCDDDIETVDHSILFCKYAYDVWAKVCDWWGLPLHANLSISELFDEHCGLASTALGSKIWQAVTWICGYLIWRNRNHKVFKGETWNTQVALCEIQVKTHEWIAKRCKDKTID